MELIGRENEKVSILVVEDEFLIAEWVAEALAEQGFAVKTVSNARDALMHLACCPVDVLFTDINLADGMDGATLARRARELRPQLAVFYASARVTLPPEVRVPDAIFLRKPYDAEAVGRLIAERVKPAKVLVPA